MRWLRQKIAVMLGLLGLLLAAPALAAPPHIAPELVVEGPAMPGGKVTVAVLMKPEKGWHGYWSNPGDAGLGLTLDWRLPAGASAGALQYPTPGILLLSGLMNHVFESDYAVLAELNVPANARPGAVLPIRAKAEWLACTDKICVPESAEISARVPIGNGARDARFDKWRAALPAPLGAKAGFAMVGGKIRLAIPLPAAVTLDAPHLFVADEMVVDYAAPQTYFRDGDRLVVELARAKFEPVVPGVLHAVLRLDRTGNGVTIDAAPAVIPPGVTPLAPSRATPALPWLLLSALLGGLLLNVMPCVFPILSLKALSLARAGESEAQARAEGLAYTAGVVLASLALGALLLGLRAGGEQVGWAFQLQEPLVVAGLLLLAVTITANLLGLFEFAVPGFAQEGSPQGAFATGLLAAFVATPCTGPFMAAAMGAALLLPVAEALALFGMLGLGLALPFLALAFVPALRRMLPRPGAWMERFRNAMALPMGLTGLALLWLASRVGGQDFALFCLVAAVMTIVFLAIVGKRQRAGLSNRIVAPALLTTLVFFAATVLPPRIAPEGSAEASILSARPFSEDALALARAQGKPVFAYFTADWCLTCKVNEAGAIEREDTRAAFGKAGVVVLRGDWTRRDPVITRYLTAQGAAGVPFYVWYPAGGGAAQQLPQVLTPAMLAELAAGN